MTRRIIAAILLSVWTTLIAGGVAAYVTVRTVMLDELDAAIVQRAATLNILSDAGGPAAQRQDYPGDRYLVLDEHGQTVARMSLAAQGPPRFEIASRTFTTLGDGSRVRTVTLDAAGVPTESGQPRRLRVVYSGAAEAFDRTLTRLAWTLLVGGAVAGVVAALAARLVARRALKPLRDATQAISSINVDTLDRRLDAEPLPPELRPVATTLNDMLSALAEAVAQRRQFIADASHELRTPLAAIIMAIEVSLSRPRSEPDQRQTLQRCLANATSLRRLVEHLLDRVRSDHVAAAEPATVVRVDDLLDQVVAQVASLAEQRGVRIERSCEAALQVTTQPHRLRSIVLNLVSNAIDHNLPGRGVRVSADAVEDDFVLTVSDNGPGIAAEHQARVFEPFYRVSPSRESNDGHVGLGLYLVQSHVQALGGRYVLESEEGKGTVIRVFLPGRVSRTDVSGPSPNSASRPAGAMASS